MSNFSDATVTKHCNFEEFERQCLQIAQMNQVVSVEFSGTYYELTFSEFNNWQ